MNECILLKKTTTKMLMIIVSSIPTLSPDIYFDVFFYYVFCLGALMYLNEATFLNNIALRYKKDQIYTV